MRLEGWLPGPCHTLGTQAVFPEFSLVVCFLQPSVSLSASKELASGNTSAKSKHRAGVHGVRE